MDNTVYIIADTSASFKEGGKAALQRNLLTAVMSAAHKAPYRENVFSYIGWNDELSEIVPIDVENDLQVAFSGGTSFLALTDLVREIGCGGRFLILSDGGFSDEEIGQMEQLTAAAKAVNAVFVTVFVGADADMDNMAKLAIPENKCFRAVDVLTALQEICCRTYLPNTAGIDNGGRSRRRFL